MLISASSNPSVRTVEAVPHFEVRTLSDEYFKLYEDGKHRRYSLLFSVNGGAFAIAKWLLDPKVHENATPCGHVVGNLTLTQVSLGMVVFTVFMVLDIYWFGKKMKKRLGPSTFAWQGQLVLGIIGALLIAGWLRAGF